jgi:hypothetical protein
MFIREVRMLHISEFLGHEPCRVHGFPIIPLPEVRTTSGWTGITDNPNWFWALSVNWLK